jgi:tetratricopeptide (TPR) repeat protein/DNA-binding MarR family transcriptional regulator
MGRGLIKMRGQRSLIPVEKRILLHLLNYHRFKEKVGAPFESTLLGIAQSVGTGKGYISISLNKLVSKDYVQEYNGRVNGRKKIQKFFLLTQKGREYTKKLKKELAILPIILKWQDGKLKSMPLEEIRIYLEKHEICSDLTEIEIYKLISRNGILDIEQLKYVKKMQFIDFSTEAPEITHFFGRKRENALLKKYVKDEEGYNIIYIHGIAGIGKTTLTAKLIGKYRGSKHLFWHNFQKLDSTRGILFNISVFLDKIGYDQLNIYLRTHTSYDYFEVSKILGKSIGKIDAVFVFDDFHKSNDKLRDFFVYFLKMLSSSSKTKMIILSRELVPFYDRRDVIGRKIVAELELEGLDFESSKKILKEKGIDKKRYEEIYGFTAGNPLFLEFIESGDNLDKYMHDELFFRLAKEERRILGIFSIYRFPVTEEVLSAFDDFEFEVLYTLTRKSIVKKDARNRYFIHDIIKKFFNGKLSPAKRKKYHLTAARWFEKRNDPMDKLESIYHYQKIQDYKKASHLAIHNSESILNGGYASQFLFTLESLDEKNLASNIWTEILILKGRANNMCGELKKALLCFTQSAKIAATIPDNKLEGEAVCESGHILEEQNELEKALACFKKCLDFSQEVDYPLGIGLSYRGIGRIRWRKSEHEEAISYFEKCIEISKKSNNNNLMISTYIDLGNVYDEILKSDKAIECYKRSLNILKKSKNVYETTRAYGNLAVTYRHLKNFEKAIEYHEKQLELTHELRDPKVKGYGYAGIGYCFAKIDEYEKAGEYAKKAEDIALKIGSENILFDVNKTFALICIHKKKSREAIKFLQKNIEIVEKLNSFYSLSESHIELGKLYNDIDQPDIAKKHFTIAAEINNKLGIEKTEALKEQLFED